MRVVSHCCAGTACLSTDVHVMLKAGFQKLGVHFGDPHEKGSSVSWHRLDPHLGDSPTFNIAGALLLKSAHVLGTEDPTPEIQSVAVGSYQDLKVYP